MFATWGLLLQSRKFWTGTLTIVGVLGAVLMVALGKVDAAHLVPTIMAITATGLTLIGTTAWEDTSKTKANAQINAAEALRSSTDRLSDNINQAMTPAPKDADKEAES